LEYVRLAAWRQAYTQIGRHEDAVAESEQAIKLLGNLPAATASLAQTYALAGRGDEARQLLRELERIDYRYVSSYHLAGLHVTLRQFDDAVTWLQRAFDEKSNWLAFMRIDPIMDPVRDRPQFKSIEASIFDR
jgi:tetratricopeptide (TPR) repeat protein